MNTSYSRHLSQLRGRGLLPGTVHAVYVAGSRVRGWGNAGSDLDFYVIVEDRWPGPGSSVAPVALRPDTITIEQTRVNREQWDVQYWLDSQVDQVLEKVSWTEFETNESAGALLTSREVDFLERLAYAVAVTGADWLLRRRQQMQRSALRSILTSRSLHNSHLFLEDAVGQLRSGDVESAVLSARLALGCAVQALLAENGKFAQSPKWSARQLRDTPQDVLSFDEYWTLETMRGYTPENPGRWVEDVLTVCRRISQSVRV
ncbi:nucleotidyltransferase domain-containing protein [Micromonospora sp. NPDC047074]|uniref:nucleotidyltransferase domain-containing protein n=1 Tax=Micromonospora sp. NPDC047074 TaxID=3154339 RepID=UPI0033CE43C7